MDFQDIQIPVASISDLITEINQVYDERQPDSRMRDKSDTNTPHHFRYEMFNHSPLCQTIAGRRAILDVIEPLLGEDCHIIANICWRNTPGEMGLNGGKWYLDGGPHIPLRSDQVWPENLPHPVFAIGAHIFLTNCPRNCGPTGVNPGSHKSGTHPPEDRGYDDELSWNGVKVKPLVAKAGDVALIVSDIWHRRLPTQKGDTGTVFPAGALCQARYRPTGQNHGVGESCRSCCDGTHRFGSRTPPAGAALPVILRLLTKIRGRT